MLHRHWFDTKTHTGAEADFPIIFRKEAAMVSVFPLLVSLAAYLPAVSTPIVSGTCVQHVWMISTPPDVFGYECSGDCAPPYDCTPRSQFVNGLCYYYCKCIHDGVPPEPDSSACTTVVTLNPATHAYSYYCVDQACPAECFGRTVTHVHRAPCFCDD